MSGNNLVLDTNIVIDLFKKTEQVRKIIAKTPTVFVPVTVLGELYLGAYRSADQAKKIEEIQNFLLTCKLLEIQQSTANFYGKVKANLLTRGRPIPENDVWIAAIAIQHNLEPYTNDSHFREVDGLMLFNPLTPI